MWQDKIKLLISVSEFQKIEGKTKGSKDTIVSSVPHLQNKFNRSEIKTVVYFNLEAIKLKDKNT